MYKIPSAGLLPFRVCLTFAKAVKFLEALIKDDLKFSLLVLLFIVFFGQDEKFASYQAINECHCSKHI